MWCRPSWLSVETYGLILVFFSSILYALAGAFVKLAKIPSTELVFARGIFQGSLVLVGLYFCRDDKNQRLIAHPFGKTATAQKLVWMRGLIGGAGFVLDYHCMSVLPLGDAMTLMSLYPFITIILARIFLEEEIKVIHIGTTIASVLGAIFIGQPTFLFSTAARVNDGTGKDSPTLGYITGLLGSCCLASILILIRKAGKIGVSTFQLLLSWALFGVGFSFIIGPYEGDWIWPSSALVWGYVVGVCFVGAGCHFMLNYAARFTQAGFTSVVRSSDILFAYCFEILLFDHRPNMYTLIGVILVVGSLVTIGIAKVKENRNNIHTLKERKEKFDDSV